MISDSVLPKRVSTSTTEAQLRAAIRARKGSAQVKRLERRANTILNRALHIAAMEDRIGVWELQISSDPIAILAQLREGTISFILIVHARKWKGDIRRCPLLAIMPMTFPARWFELHLYRLKREMSDLCGTSTATT